MLNKKEQLLKHFLYNATAHWLWKPMALKSNFTSEFFLQSCGLPATFRKGLGKNDLYNRRKYSPIAFNINTKTSSAKIVCLKSRNFESYSLFKNFYLYINTETFKMIFNLPPLSPNKSGLSDIGGDFLLLTVFMFGFLFWNLCKFIWTLH